MGYIHFFVFIFLIGEKGKGREEKGKGKRKRKQGCRAALNATQGGTRQSTGEAKANHKEEQG